jgi:hypothetical protein
MIPTQTTVFKCERTGRIFASAAEARQSEQDVPKSKIETLKRRIQDGEYWIPVVGDVVYVATALSIDHGEDVVGGGLALVTSVSYRRSGGEPCPFIEVAQIGSSHNWGQFLFKKQAQLMGEFGDEFAIPEPDYGPSGYDPHEWS